MFIVPIVVQNLAGGPAGRTTLFPGNQRCNSRRRCIPQAYPTSFGKDGWRRASFPHPARTGQVRGIDASGIQHEANQRPEAWGGAWRNKGCSAPRIRGCPADSLRKNSPAAAAPPHTCQNAALRCCYPKRAITHPRRKHTTSRTNIYTVGWRSGLLCLSGTLVVETLLMINFNDQFYITIFGADSPKQSKEEQL